MKKVKFNQNQEKAELSLLKRFSMFLGKALREHPLIFFLVLSVIENFIIESLSRHSVVEGFEHIVSHPMVFIYNSLIIMFTLSFALLFRRRLFGTVLFSMPWIICGFINSVILTYRVTPLGAIDFQIARFGLILMYLSPVQRIMLYVGVGLFIVSIIFLWLLGPKVTGKMHYGKNTAAIAGSLAAILVMTGLAHQFKILSTDFGNLVGAYDNYGFVYCFTSSIIDTGIDKPDDYNQKGVEEILSELPETNAHEEMIKPDVVLIQLESFIDAKNLKDVTFSDDPAPIFSYLRENYSTGRLEVPSFGGGTANTEFEVLTGMNLDYFGAGEYPYKTILLEETCETMAYNLKELGYSAHAIHNHTGNFYDRDKVYPNMGFDSFQSKEYMYDYDTTYYDWCKDAVLTKEIMTALSYTDEENGITADRPRFVWTVSVQGHGAYPTEPIEGVDTVIKIESNSFTEEEMCSLEYYINQLYEMDMFLGNLIAALEQRGKPTMLIAYGDHLPALNIQPEDLKAGHIYKTEYVTWNNFGLEKKDRDLRTYELQGEVMKQLGYNNGNMVKLHQLRSREDSPLSEKELQRQIKCLAYDMLYGDNFQFGGEKPYAPVDMRMGTLPITASGLKVMENIVYVQGEGFTTKSRIFVNGKKQKTVMLSQYSLMAKDVTLNPGDEITVGQSSSKKEVLSYSDPIIYEEELHMIPTSQEQAEIKN
ncbi:MAG: sulfatase-like hydrolase/transferase [Clostridia bacterium]|nr:sulfatase-like hydrolase/transferase [Clostridia bacterium]